MANVFPAALEGAALADVSLRASSEEALVEPSSHMRSRGAADLEEQGVPHVQEPAEAALLGTPPAAWEEGTLAAASTSVVAAQEASSDVTPPSTSLDEARH